MRANQGKFLVGFEERDGVVRRTGWRFRVSGWLWGLCCAAAVFPPCAVAQECAGTRLLDLTAAPPASKGKAGMPGGEAGGIAGADSRRPRPYGLPLEVILCPPQEVVLRRGEKLVLEILLRNRGDVVFDLPVSRSDWTVHAQGEIRRRMFRIRVRRPGSGMAAWAAILFGAASRPDALVRLPPGESVRIRLAVDSGELTRAVLFEQGRVELEVVCSEWTSDDDQYFIRQGNDSQEVVSATSFSVVLKR